MSGQPTKFELYAVYVETITAKEQRRHQVAAIYVTVISLGTALLGIYENLEPLYVVAPVGVIALFWLLNMLYFRSLAKAKFAVIEEIEKDWDFRPFELEWQKLQEQPRQMRVSLTFIEVLFPAVVLAGTLGYILYRACIGAN